MSIDSHCRFGDFYVFSGILMDPKWESELASIGEVTLFGELLKNRGLDRGSMRSLDSFGLVYVYRGNGFYHDERGYSSEVGPGSLLLLRPGVAHHYKPQSGSTWSEVFFLFQGKVFEAWDSTGALAEVGPVLSLTPIQGWLEHFRGLMREIRSFEKSSMHAQLNVVCQLQAIWARVIQQGSVAEDTDALWLQEASECLKRKSNDQKAVYLAAQELGMGYENFRKRFTALHGESPGKFVTSQRLLKAAELLETTQLTVGAIADELGYCDGFYFSRQFTKQTGLSPTAYRKAHIGRIESNYLQPRIYGEISV